MRVNAITMRDHFGCGVSFGGGTRGCGFLCKRAPATLYPHHSVGVLEALASKLDLVAGPARWCSPHRQTGRLGSVIRKKHAQRFSTVSA